MSKRRVDPHSIFGGNRISVEFLLKERFVDLHLIEFCRLLFSLKITDWFYDIDSHQFILWSDTIPVFNPPAHQGIPSNLFVHTAYTMVC